MDKIRYTEDKWGCLVFPIETDLTRLNFDNCFVAIGTMAIWVFPFNKLNRYIQEYENFKKFLEGKQNYYYLDGQVSNRTYHYACKNKFNYLTGKCQENVSPNYWHKTCSGFEVEDRFSFRWHKAICKFVRPVYCDMTGEARRKMYFEELCPTPEVEKANKKVLSERGKRAGLSRAIKTKCGGCAYDVVCQNRWQKAEQKCYVSRKMLNRKIRKIAENHFGSFEKLLELFRYSNTSCEGYTVLFPISTKLFVVFDKANGWHNQFSRKTTRFIKEKINPNPLTPQLEYDAKVYMLFLYLALRKSSGTILDYKTQHNNNAYQLLWFRSGRSYHNVRQYEYKCYDDIFKLFGVEGLFK